MALFLTKPELYARHTSVKNKQEYFFEEFHKFADKYYSSASPADALDNVFFSNVCLNGINTQNICGGKSGAGNFGSGGSSAAKQRFKSAEESRANRIAKFKKAYSVKLEPGMDERLFLGVSEIWNKLGDASEIVAKSRWPNAANIAYADDTFATPFPEVVEKQLVPLKIRNKVMQKKYPTKNDNTDRFTKIVDTAAEEEAAREAATAAPKPNAEFVFVPPPELEDDDW